MSQTQRIMDVLQDERPHSVPEIHERAGTSRLNSRISDLRRKLAPKGKTIVCSRVKGKQGAAAYEYQIVPLRIDPSELDWENAEVVEEDVQLALKVNEYRGAPQAKEEG